MQNQIIELQVVDSTQTYIKQNSDFKLYDCCYATKQTAGYGRTGNWDSDYQNLYFSKLLPVDNYNHLTAICSMHMLAAIYSTEFEIKVPNDLYLFDKKCGGFIIENIDDKAILGIGININGAPDQFISVSEVTNSRIDIDQVARQLDDIINLNLSMAPDMLEDYYKRNCRLLNKQVEYIELSSGDSFTGTVTALDSESITIDGLKFNQMQIKILNK